MRAYLAILPLAFLALQAGCNGGQLTRPYFPVTGGDVAQGKKVITKYGCGACHTIPGIHAARGVVGPPLYFWGRRTMIAGELPNTPENLVRWLQDPPSAEPGTAMPKLGLSDQQARDAAAYLYTLR